MGDNTRREEHVVKVLRNNGHPNLIINAADTWKERKKQQEEDPKYTIHLPYVAESVRILGEYAVNIFHQNRCGKPLWSWGSVSLDLIYVGEMVCLSTGMFGYSQILYLYSSCSHPMGFQSPLGLSCMNLHSNVLYTTPSPFVIGSTSLILLSCHPTVETMMDILLMEKEKLMNKEN